MHEGALLEIGQNVCTLFGSLDRSVRLQTVDRCHFQFAALVVLLEVDHRCGQIREGRTEERTQRHPARAEKRTEYFFTGSYTEFCQNKRWCNTKRIKECSVRCLILAVQNCFHAHLELLSTSLTGSMNKAFTSKRNISKIKVNRTLKFHTTCGDEETQKSSPNHTKRWWRTVKRVEKKNNDDGRKGQVGNEMKFVLSWLVLI